MKTLYAKLNNGDKVKFYTEGLHTMFTDKRKGCKHWDRPIAYAAAKNFNVIIRDLEINEGVRFVQSVKGGLVNG